MMWDPSCKKIANISLFHALFNESAQYGAVRSRHFMQSFLHRNKSSINKKEDNSTMIVGRLCDLRFINREWGGVSSDLKHIRAYGVGGGLCDR